jgi:hypothetical protein
MSENRSSFDHLCFGSPGSRVDRCVVAEGLEAVRAVSFQTGWCSGKQPLRPRKVNTEAH